MWGVTGWMYITRSNVGYQEIRCVTIWMFLSVKVRGVMIFHVTRCLLCVDKEAMDAGVKQIKTWRQDKNTDALSFSTTFRNATMGCSEPLRVRDNLVWSSQNEYSVKHWFNMDDFGETISHILHKHTLTHKHNHTHTHTHTLNTNEESAAKKYRARVT